jgi:type I restriction enzyme S subunit
MLTAQEPSAKYLVNLQPPLVRHFDLIAQAPGGVARLRELILTLAVQGKLIPQDASDEPASELLKKIRTEKDRLIAEGKIKRDKPLAEIADDEKPFELPAGWEWVRLQQAFDVRDGTHATPKYQSTGYPLVTSKNLYGGILDLTDVKLISAFDHEQISVRSKVDRNDILFAMIGSIGNPVLVNTDVEFSVKNVALFKYYAASLSCPQYLLLVLKSESVGIKVRAAGGVQSFISLGQLRSSVIALPPLAEQSRIVTRVEELMQLCDTLEASGQLEAQQHTQLVSTLLGTLTQSETPEALADNWQRIATHFDLLLDRPEAVDALEQTILQLAVRGLLVPQDPTDEPASALLQRVSHLNAANLGKKKKLADDELPLTPYALPTGWAWAQLGELVENMGSGWSPACDEGERSEPTQWAVLRTTAVQVNEFRSREHKVIPSKLSPRPEIEVKDGDILITRAGPINRVGISCWVDSAPPRLMLSDKIVRFHSVADEMLPAFIVLALNTGWTKEQIEAAKSGMAASQVNISQSELRNFWVPVCSKAEQSRIVTRVNELRGLCADLRQRIVATQSGQKQFAVALIENASS